MKNKKSVIVVAICLALVASTGIYIKCATKKGVPGKMGKGGPGKGGFGPQETLVSVKVMEAKKNVLHDFVKTNGEIESKSNIAVFPDIGGKVYKNFVSLGSVVKKGDVICEIDPNEPGTYYAHSQVYSPVSGTVISTMLEPGTKVSTQSVITTIGDVENLQVKAKIVERYSAYLRKGLKAKIILEAYPDEVFDAVVSKVSPVLDQTSRTKEVVLDFKQKDERVNAGMFAKITLYTVDYDDKVTVPATCVVSKGSHRYVFVLSDDEKTAVKKEVVLGHTVEAEVQVDGIDEGSTVIVEGMSVLTDGSKVKIIGRK